MENENFSEVKGAVKFLIYVDFLVSAFSSIFVRLFHNCLLIWLENLTSPFGLLQTIHLIIYIDQLKLDELSDVSEK